MGDDDDKMKNVFEASEVPSEEKVYLKKDSFGWRVVNPIRDPETNKINKFNLFFGGKRNLFTLAFLMILFLLIFVGVNELISNYKKVVEDPCGFCTDCHLQTTKVLSKMKFNKPIEINFNFSGGDRGG